MHLSRLTPIFLLNLAAASPGCRNNLCAGTPCPAPSSCTTYSQTLTTCIPAPTCLSVYRLLLRHGANLLLRVLRRDQMPAHGSEVAGLRRGFPAV
ncbi:uncharacterized protein CDV56_100921 [Aspergillus thermomutatus]|uniref:Secreted protein n=1 Tax=Aspergillus thermomutatus TaxID=41047 RepID=A0A397FZT1_ASPTH|nr:uncharacterized protein CDV56_100921 [Aspergillus thermomutatus]RHZ43084.1 hypothetical protein CDV56_100921 [Aspergillus thermomutatus]